LFNIAALYEGKRVFCKSVEMAKEDLSYSVHRPIRLYYFTEMDKSTDYDYAVRKLDHGAWIEKRLCESEFHFLQCKTGRNICGGPAFS
jgi:hypothetical protein